MGDNIDRAEEGRGKTASIRLLKLGHHIDRVLSLVVKKISYIGIAMLASMMLLTVSDVFFRYFFNRPIMGSTEIVEFMMLILAFTVIAYTALEKSHVKVDLVTSRLPKRVRTILEIFTYIFSIALYACITWRYIPVAIENLKIDQRSVVLGMPTSPLYIILIIGSGLLCLVLLDQLAKLFNEVFRK